MNDLVSKATFGFLMAQLFPGAIAAFAIGFLYFSNDPAQPASVLAAAERTLSIWGAASVAHQLFLVAVCIATGMLIHGLNWAALGALEKALHGAVFNSKFHGWPIAAQIAAGPARAAWELVHLLYAPKHIRDARMEENVTRVGKDQMPQFQWLQDFYLHSAQFFAHVALSLLVALLAIAHFIVMNGLTGRRVMLLIILYLMSGIFFVLGRVQFASLFTAEEKLAGGGAGASAGRVEAHDSTPAGSSA